jgi:hypothetical protein
LVFLKTGLLLAVAGPRANAVYVATSADGPWFGTGEQGVYNNPTLVPRQDGSVVLFCHDCAHGTGTYHGYGDSATGIMGELAAGSVNYTWKEWVPPASGQDGGNYISNLPQLLVISDFLNPFLKDCL